MNRMNIALGLLALSALAAEAASLQSKDLPAAVQKTVQETFKAGQIRSISRETENGVTQYEVESMLYGKRRNFDVVKADGPETKE